MFKARHLKSGLIISVIIWGYEDLYQYVLITNDSKMESYKIEQTPRGNVKSKAR